MGSDLSSFHYVQVWQEYRSEKGWWHSFELPDGKHIDGVCSLDGLRHRLSQFPIPEDLRGKRVLDIGTWDGWFAFEMEKRGAEVMAIDCWDNPRFHEVHQILGSRVDYRELDVYELTSDHIGRFDIVLFLGVLYHLKHPLLALERVCALTTDLAAVESFFLTERHLPGIEAGGRALMEFYETTEFGGQTDNWIGPTLPCLTAFCRTAGFARVELRNILEHSVCLACYRHWDEPGESGPAPVLLDAFHHANFGINFCSGREEYITAHFEWSGPAEEISLDAVKPEVGSLGVRPVFVGRAGGGWQVCFLRPPGLKPGWHPVCLRVGGSPRSDARRLAVDLAAAPVKIALVGLFDAFTWRPNEVDLGAGGMISAWLSGLPENADRNNLQAFLDNLRLNVIFVEQREDGAPRQVNAALPASAEAGEYELVFQIAGIRSDPARLAVRPAGSSTGDGN